MPIYNAGLTGIDIVETRRYAGLARCVDFPEELLRQACNEARVQAVPRGTWRVYPYSCDTATILAPQPLTLAGYSIQEHLTNAVYIAVMAITVGLQIEQAITNAFKHDHYTAGLLLDAAATTAVETVADQVNQLITQEAQRSGYITLPRFSPGYGDWDITVQPMVLALADGAAIDVSVNEAAMLIPRKSITAVIGFIPNGKTVIERLGCQNIPCTTCSQPNCLSRRG